MNKTSELINHAKLRLSNAHSQIEPIRRGASINPSDVWDTLGCIETAGKKLTEAAELSLKADARIEELEDMLSRLVKENDLAMPNENYQWMYSPMRVECLKILENK